MSSPLKGEEAKERKEPKESSDWLAGMNGTANRTPRPATLNGVGPSSVTLPSDVRAYPHVIDFLGHRFANVPRATWARRMADGRVIDSDGRAINEATLSIPRERVYYYRDVGTERRIPFDEVVLYQDDYLVVADKPHFLPVIPSGRYVQETLLTRLKQRLEAPPRPEDGVCVLRGVDVRGRARDA